MKRNIDATSSSLNEQLHSEAQVLRTLAPAGLHASIMAHVNQAPQAAAHTPQAWRVWLPLAAAALLVVAGWGTDQLVLSRRAQLGPASLHALQEVTAAPARAVRQLTDAPRLREVGRELRGAVESELDDLGAQAGAFALALARHLGGPLSKLSRLR